MTIRFVCPAVLVLVLCACTGGVASPIYTATTYPTTTANPTHMSTSTPSSVPPATLMPGTEMPLEVNLTLIRMADSLYKSGEYEMALVVYTEMLNYGPDPDLYSLRADTYDRLGDFDAAISDYLTAVDLGTKKDSILNNICWDLGIIGQAEKALPYCEQAVEVSPSPSNRDSRGLTYAQLEMTQEAIADFQAVADELKDATDSRLKNIATERQEWITSLEAGVNPITPEVLTKLRNDTSDVIATSTPVPETIAVSRSSVQKAAHEMGFAFGEVDTSGSEEKLTGNKTDGSCKGVLELVGPETGLTAASLQTMGCSDKEQSGLAYWFMGGLLPGEREKAKAIVYMVVDVYYVIEGEVETTGEKKIGNVIFEAKRSSDPMLVFEITARFKK